MVSHSSIFLGFLALIAPTLITSTPIDTGATIFARDPESCTVDYVGKEGAGCGDHQGDYGCSLNRYDIVSLIGFCSACAWLKGGSRLSVMLKLCGWRLHIVVNRSANSVGIARRIALEYFGCRIKWTAWEVL